MRKLKQQSKTAKSESGSGRIAALPEHLLNRSMPESIEAEAAVIGSMIIDPQRIGQVIGVLKSESFYHFAHQAIFDSLIKLYENSAAVDLVLLRDELKKRKQLDEI